MIVDRLFGQSSAINLGVDRCQGGVRLYEQCRTVDLADQFPVNFDAGIWPDHLQVESDAAGPHRSDHVAEDVHDVLGIYSSE